MEDKRIVYEAPDGSLAVVVPARKQKAGESDQEYLDEIAAKAEKQMPAGMSRKVTVDKTELPQSRYFRGQWRADSRQVFVDMNSARQHKMDLIRQNRNQRLDATDKEKARLDEVGTDNEKQELAQKRQALRDLPQTIDLASMQTPEELEAFEPEWP